MKHILEHKINFKAFFFYFLVYELDTFEEQEVNSTSEEKL